MTDLMEQAALGTEFRVWSAEASIHNAMADAAEIDLHLYERRLTRPNFARSDVKCAQLDAAYGRKGCQAERVAYDWRCDHGEWPSAADLTERLAARTGISRRAATIRIERAVNDPDPDRHLYIIHGVRLRSILTGEPMDPEPSWNVPNADMRFYVAAPGHARWERLYDMLRMAAA